MEPRPYAAFGPAGEIELGLRYLDAPRIPEAHRLTLTGCALVRPGVVACSIAEADRVLLLRVATGEILEELRATRPEGLWSAGDGRLYLGQPSQRAYTRLDLDTGARTQITYDDVYPTHVARFGDGVLIADGRRRCVWEHPAGGEPRRVAIPVRTLVPRATAPLTDGSFLYCDRDTHIVARVHRDGRLLWQYGGVEDPSAELDRLANPEHVASLGAGRFAVCDMRNNRILILTEDGRCVGSHGSSADAGAMDGSLWAPAAAAPSDGGLVVADAGNARVLEVRPGRADRTLWGRALVERCLFDHPRSCAPLGDEVLVADCYHNAITPIALSGRPGPSIQGALGRRLFWPRNTAIVDGELYYSDSRNRRILRSLHGVTAELVLRSGEDSRVPLGDPHSIRPGGRLLLVTDTELASVFAADRTGRLHFTWGPRRIPGVPGVELELSDVHDAAFDERGGIWICDSGHDRLVLVDASPLVGAVDGGQVRRVIADAGLRSPRSVEVLPRGELLVSDSDNHRVVVLDAKGEVAFGYGGRSGHALDHLANPRQALIHRGRLFIADCINNRVMTVPVELLRSPDRKRAYTSSR